MSSHTDTTLLEPRFEDILKAYADWLPEKVCYSCEKSDQLVEFAEGDTGWWCPDCESSEVYYVRASFLEELHECEVGVNEDITQELQKAREEEEIKIAKNMIEAAEKQGENMGTLSGFLWWAKDVLSHQSKEV